jgi:hypothetical protein
MIELNDQKVFVSSSTTGTQPASVADRPSPVAHLTTGTHGADVVEYSRPATAVKRETYVIAKKR